MNGQNPHVRPSYAAFAAMAQIVGSGNGTTQIAALTLNGLSSNYVNYVRGYTIYTQGALSGVVIINGMTANSSVSNKGSLSVTVNFPGSSGHTVYVSQLTADGAEVTSGATFNGISYETSNGKPSGSASVQTVQVGSDGNAVITVRDSQAVVANLDYALGSHTATVPNAPKAKSSAVATLGCGAQTAALTATLTTALALASSLSGCSAEPSSPTKKSGSNSSLTRSRTATSNSRRRAVLLGIGVILVLVFFLLGR
jgi:hypothetical protein